jgi:hypothetical protein
MGFTSIFMLTQRDEVCFLTSKGPIPTGVAFMVDSCGLQNLCYSLPIGLLGNYTIKKIDH